MTTLKRDGSLDEGYDQTFQDMEDSVHDLVALVPQPKLVETKMGPVFRYEERLPEQAVVLKLVGLVSTLRAAQLLLHRGFVQELGMLERVIGDLHQDVLFLLTGHEDSALKTRYQRFLEDFWQEEFDADTAIASTQKRGMVPRQKIRAHISRFTSKIPGFKGDQSQLTENLRTVDKAQSGYIHGAAPHLLDLFGGSPPRFQFHMNGMLGTVRESEHREQFWNYVYRSICTFSLASHAFGDSAGAAKWRAYADRFAASAADLGSGVEKPEERADWKGFALAVVTALGGCGLLLATQQCGL